MIYNKSITIAREAEIFENIDLHVGKHSLDFLGGAVVQYHLPMQETQNADFNPGSGRFPGVRDGNAFQHLLRVMKKKKK